MTDLEKLAREAAEEALRIAPGLDRIACIDTAEETMASHLLSHLQRAHDLGAAGERVDSLPGDLRWANWTVAIHNDYRLNGKSHTFWLLTRGERCVKGEGRTDAEALNEIRQHLGFVRPSQAIRERGKG